MEIPMTSAKELDLIGKDLSSLRTTYSRLNWVKYTTGMDFGVNGAYEAIMNFLSDDTCWNTVLDSLGSSGDDLKTRKATILYRTFRPFHLSQEMRTIAGSIQQLNSELSRILNTHRFTVGGREVSAPEIGMILAVQEDRELRKEAFLSRITVAEPLVNAGFPELLGLRREYALGMGEKDFVSHSLKEQDLDENLFASWPDELKKVLPQMELARSEIALEYIGTEEIMPWDEAYIASVIAPGLHRKVDMSSFMDPVADLFSLFGFDIRSMNITYDIFPRKHKSEWGYNFPIETGVDSRILANVSNRFSEFRVLLHETGHGVHSFSTDSGETVLNMGISGITSEGIANLFGSFRTREIFYGQFFKGEDLEQARASFGKLARWTRASQLRNIARIIFDARLNTELPKTLEEIEALRWSTDNELLSSGPYADRPVWANTIHHTTHPVYLHNYLLGDLMCDMLEDVFVTARGVKSITDKPLEFGEFLRTEVIEPSGRFPFPELFKRISGEELSLRYLTARIQKELER